MERRSSILFWRDYSHQVKGKGGDWSITTSIASCYVPPFGPASSKQHFHLIIGITLHIVLVSTEGRAPSSCAGDFGVSSVSA